MYQGYVMGSNLCVSPLEKLVGITHFQYLCYIYPPENCGEHEKKGKSDEK